MATFVLIHGGGDVGWHWHLLQRELTSRGHDSVAPDLPCDDDSATLVDYADSVVAAVGDRRNLVVVGHSYGAFTAPLVADRLRADALVLLAGMIPSPGEVPTEWWDNTGHAPNSWWDTREMRISGFRFRRCSSRNRTPACLHVRDRPSGNRFACATLTRWASRGTSLALGPAAGHRRGRPYSRFCD